MDLKKRKKTMNLELGKNIISFQVLLATVLFKITREYYVVTKIDKDIKRNQKQYIASKFINLKKEGEKYKNCLTSLIYIGKSLGDAFVYLFYQNENEQLSNHLQQQENVLLPNPKSNGGFGELEFIKKTPFFNGNIVLYHNITNILRLGDVSLFNLETGKLTGIGELKTHRIGNTLNIQLTIIGHKSQPLHFKKNDRQTKDSNTKPFQVPNEERFKKQIKTIQGSFEYLNTKNPTVKTFIQYNNYYKLLEQIVNSNKGGFTIEAVDRAIAIGCFRIPKSSFSERIMWDYTPDSIQDDLGSVSGIFNAPKHNYMLFGSLQYNKGVNASILPGVQPLIWSRINNAVLKQIIFGEIFIITLFNPGHLICDFEKLGFVLSDDKRLLYKMDGNKRIGFEGLEYCFKLITDFLQHEKVIIDTINKSLEKMNEMDIKVNTKAIINYQF
ncbi:hypothetical protein [Aurantibacillus circumpalustris]|uniref:hypothetical protein n=1 Tax=Aurantibacillus circumpalustris TaxID=3036359 RepID=UPI00295B2E34|nr:hypothetical protein [Aurantibacillus circumpalustris]